MSSAKSLGNRSREAVASEAPPAPESASEELSSPPLLRHLQNDGDELALSPTQASMWAASLRNPAAGPNIIQILIRFTAPLSATSLQEAWQATIARNDALRVRIQTDLNGIPSARLDREAAETWLDVAGSFPHEFEKTLESDRARPFDESAPPFRCRYWPESGVLLWTMHHVLLDGRCIAQVLRSFFSHIDGADVHHPQRMYGALQPGISDLEALHDVWGELPKPVEQRRRPNLNGSTRSDQPGRHQARIPFAAAALDSLTKAAKNADTTAHCLAQWAWAFTLGRVFARRDIVLGVVRSGHWAIDNQKPAAGYLMNTLPVIASTDGNTTLGNALRDYRDAILKVRDRIDADPRLAAAQLGRSPLDPWDAIVISERATLEEQALQDAPVGLVQNLQIYEAPNEPLSGSAWLGANPALEVETDPREFSSEATELLAQTWLRSLELIASLPLSTPLAQIEPLPLDVLATEQRFENGGPALAPPGETIWQAFSKVVAEQPDAPAIMGRHYKLTYQELLQSAEALASALSAAGARPGDCIASRLDDRNYAAASLLACARLGAIYMPFDRDLPRERVQQMTKQAAPVALIRDANPDPFKVDIIQIDPRPLSKPKRELSAYEAHDPFAPFCLLFTSGSTGAPKGVLNHHHGILNEALFIVDQLEIRSRDRVLQFASLGFDASLEEILSCLLGGATLVPRNEEILEGFDHYHRFLQENEITIVDLPTAFWSAWSAWLAQRRASPPEPLRAVVIGGEKASASATNAWLGAARGRVPVFNTYGPTEASIIATSGRLRIPRGGGDPAIGHPISGMAARLMDPLGRPAAPGCVGEIMLAGCGVGLGYLNNPQATAAAFFTNPETKRPAWYRTGDLARRNDKGEIHYIARVDDQIKIRGKRIEPGDIRAALESHPHVREAYVAARTILDHPTLVAWVVAPEEDESSLKAHLRKELPPWMIPSHFVLLEEIPLNERGKVDRNSLPNPNLNTPTGTRIVSPLEKWMITVFAEVLRVDASKIDSDRDFAAQGGDSLSAMSLVSRLVQAGIDLEPGELVTDSSPRFLAKRIDKNYGKARTKWDPILRLRAGNPEKTPLVLIHATPGDVLGYANLITEFPDDVPCLGVVSRSLHLPHNPHTSIEEMAGAYIEALTPHLKGKRWVLAGWCYGGIVAFEMARQLVARGDAPPVIALIEAWAYNPADKMARRRLKLAKLMALLRGPGSRRKAWRESRRRGKEAITNEPGHTADEGFARSAAYAANIKAVNDYQPGSYKGEVHLFLTDDPNAPVLQVKHGGWHVTGARCVTHSHRGSHEKVLRPPHVSDLSRNIVNLLESETETR